MSPWEPVNKLAAGLAGLLMKGTLATGKEAGLIAATASRSLIGISPGVIENAVVRSAGVARGAVEVAGETAAGAVGLSYKIGRGILGKNIFAKDLYGELGGTPFQLHRNLQNKLVLGTLGVAGGLGVAAGSIQKSQGYQKYNVEMSPSGVMEVSRPDMLGASGSLPLAMRNNR